VLAGHGEEAAVYPGVLASFFPLDVHPAVAVPGLFFRVRKPLVHDMFVLARDETVVAVVTKGDVYY
jgi:hypothetical protein